MSPAARHGSARRLGALRWREARPWGAVLIHSLRWRELRLPRPFCDPPLQIEQVLVQLLKREAEREQALERIAGQRPHEPFAADVGGLRRIGRERSLGGIERRRQGAPRERGGAC